jgi:hypothetical protein
MEGFMKLGKLLIPTIAAMAMPTFASAAYFSLPCSSSCTIHAGVSTQFLITGRGVSSGYAYYDIYAGSAFVCETNTSNNTPIWQCNGSIASPGTYTVTGVVKGFSNLQAPGDNATVSITVVP